MCKPDITKQQMDKLSGEKSFKDYQKLEAETETVCFGWAHEQKGNE